MKRLFALFLIACLGTISLYAQPKLDIIGGDTYDWKFVKPNDSPLQAKVQIKNSGDKTLEITNVKPGCGCTTAPLDKNSLKPGEIATMDIKLNISGNTGKVTKSITISSNDPSNEKKVLYLKAEIIRALMTSPTQYLTYSDITVGKEAVASLKIKNNSNQEVTLSKFEVTPETVTINLKNKVTLKPGQEVELEAKVKPEKKGYLNMTVKMNTTHPDHPEFVIQGYGNVKESAIFNSK